MSLVLDSSATLAWLYKDESTPAILGVLDRVVAEGAWAPPLWRLEIANVLTIGVRRGRNDEAFRDSSLRDLALLYIRLDPEADRQTWASTLRLAERHQLTLYDASYLEVAVRRHLPLATLDRDLRKAAHLENVSLLGIN